MKIVFDDDREDIIIGKKDDKNIKTSKPEKGKPQGSAGKSKKSKYHSSIRTHAIKCNVMLFIVNWTKSVAILRCVILSWLKNFCC